jgi:hypothetical protein
LTADRHHARFVARAAGLEALCPTYLAMVAIGWISLPDLGMPVANT